MLGRFARSSLTSAFAAVRAPTASAFGPQVRACVQRSRDNRIVNNPRNLFTAKPKAQLGLSIRQHRLTHTIRSGALSLPPRRLSRDVPSHLNEQQSSSSLLPLQAKRRLTGLVVGVPKESLDGELRVALAPESVKKLKKAGVTVKIQVNKFVRVCCCLACVVCLPCLWSCRCMCVYMWDARELFLL